MSPFLAWGDFHARSRFAYSTIPEEKWGTTRSLGFSGTLSSFSHFLDCGRSPCRSQLISKPTLWRQNDFFVFFCLGLEDEDGQALFSSLEAFTFKLQGKTVSTILVNHDVSKIA